MVLMLAAVPASANAAEGQFWQCATYARMFSGLQLFGAAAGWWSQAMGRYARGSAPSVGAVMVFKSISAMRSGHVATVSQVVSDRIVRVTHANWSSRGQVERDVEVMDTSAANDWSSVRVWFKGLRDLGQRNYPVYGFIYGGAAKAGPGVASAAKPAPRTAAAPTASPGLATTLLARAAPVAVAPDRRVAAIVAPTSPAAG